MFKSSPLNQIGGNSMSFMADQDKENTESHEDQYKCSCCSELVHSEDFSQEYGICRECYACMAEDKNVPPFDDFNEYIGEDK